MTSLFVQLTSGVTARFKAQGTARLSFAAANGSAAGSLGASESEAFGLTGFECLSDNGTFTSLDSFYAAGCWTNGDYAFSSVSYTEQDQSAGTPPAAIAPASGRSAAAGSKAAATAWPAPPATTAV